MVVNLSYDDLFFPCMGSVTFAGRFCRTRKGEGWGCARPLRGGFAQKGNGQLGGAVAQMAFPIEGILKLSR